MYRTHSVLINTVKFNTTVTALALSNYSLSTQIAQAVPPFKKKPYHLPPGSNHYGSKKKKGK